MNRASSLARKAASPTLYTVSDPGKLLQYDTWRLQGSSLPGFLYKMPSSWSLPYLAALDIVRSYIRFAAALEKTTINAESYIHMKLYVSSLGIPTPNDLAALIGKPLSEVSVAFIPNANDYYAERARNHVLGQRIAALESLGMRVASVDLRDHNSKDSLRDALAGYDLIWATGGNTFILRYEMQRSGFADIIKDLLAEGVVYGGDSAGALVAGTSLGGINLESADEPEFAEEIITDGLKLVPYIIVPHVDNPEFADVMKAVNSRPDKDKIIGLKDSQAVVFNGGSFRIVETKELTAEAV